jgi:hypothetical protein
MPTSKEALRQLTAPKWNAMPPVDGVSVAIRKARRRLRRPVLEPTRRIDDIGVIKGASREMLTAPPQ